jgi:adenylate kinase family enzyme
MMQKILVAGITGAGKTTMARALAARLAVPFHEMDALAFTGPGWQQNPHLLPEIERITAGPRWIFDSFGYPEVRDLLWSRADAIVWLDFSRAVVMRRVLRRSATRTLLRTRVFGGNVETLAAWLKPDHPAWWAWTQYASRRAEIAARCADPRFAPLEVIRLRTPRAGRRWLDTVPAPTVLRPRVIRGRGSSGADDHGAREQGRALAGPRAIRGRAGVPGSSTPRSRLAPAARRSAAGTSAPS